MSTANVQTTRAARCGLLLLAAGVMGVAACGREAPSGSAPVPAETPVELEEATYDYQVSLRGALSDTLRGDAVFGKAVYGAEATPLFVVRLRVGGDFGSGLFLARSDTTRPRPGRYRLASDPDEGFVVIYRRGLLVDLRSLSGTLVIQASTPSLLEGYFEADLQGEVARGGLSAGETIVRAAGRFQVEGGSVGFIVGL